MCEARTYLLDNFSITFGTKSYRQIISIPMGSICASLIAYLFSFCYEKVFMASLADDYQAEIPQAFSTRPSQNNSGCMERVVYHSHENQKCMRYSVFTSR